MVARYRKAEDVLNLRYHDLNNNILFLAETAASAGVGLDGKVRAMAETPTPEQRAALCEGESNLLFLRCLKKYFPQLYNREKARIEEEKAEIMKNQY